MREIVVSYDTSGILALPPDQDQLLADADALREAADMLDHRAAALGA